MRLAGPLLTAAILAVAAHPAAAATIVGLTGDRTLVIFETDAPAVTRSITVEGVDRLAGIDLRPANRTLVGVTTENVIVTIDIETGKAAEVAAMDKPLAIGDGPVIVDCRVAKLANCLPMIPSGAAHTDMILYGDAVAGTMADEAKALV